MLLVVVGHEIREVDAVGGDGVEVDDEGAVLVRRRGNAVPIDAVGGAERLVVVPPVGVGGVARVGDDDLQRDPPAPVTRKWNHWRCARPSLSVKGSSRMRTVSTVGVAETSSPLPLSNALLKW